MPSNFATLLYHRIAHVSASVLLRLEYPLVCYL